MNIGTLYIVGTPIGNLQDITLRALEVLKTADVIFAEDTRVAKKLLSHYGVDKRPERYDEHSHARVCERVKELLRAGRTIALVTDAGTPGIADPGTRLVAFVRAELPGAAIVPVPGPSAITAALSVAGVSAEHFTFAGYPPHRKGRQTFFLGLRHATLRPIVLYESPHRIKQTFEYLGQVFGLDAELIVARELTKVFEEIFRGDIKGALEHFRDERGRGEFVVIIP
ncbi:MAG: 16S rRNA (cytidine(1402)-2'-O)-methyltransferase [Candidatus Jorgensenbacteria bacterium]